MAEPAETSTDMLRTVRQIRQFGPDPVPDGILKRLLEVVQWTGSSRNTQPWHFIVIKDPEQLRKIGQLREAINWVAKAPLGIAIVTDGANARSEPYDAGRVTERILIAAHMLGLGAGVAWFGDEALELKAKSILGIPAERLAQQVVLIGRPTSVKDPRPNARPGGRKPLSEIVSYERWGNAKG
jgi:nitroreductase